jgi:hypothetical protein
MDLACSFPRTGTELGVPLQQLKELAGIRPASSTGDDAAAAVLARLDAMDAELSCGRIASGGSRRS